MKLAAAVDVVMPATETNLLTIARVRFPCSTAYWHSGQMTRGTFWCPFILKKKVSVCDYALGGLPKCLFNWMRKEVVIINRCSGCEETTTRSLFMVVLNYCELLVCQ